MYTAAEARNHSWFTANGGGVYSASRPEIGKTSNKESHGTDRLYRNVGTYQSTLCNTPEERYLIYTASEA